MSMSDARALLAAQQQMENAQDKAYSKVNQGAGAVGTAILQGAALEIQLAREARAKFAHESKRSAMELKGARAAAEQAAKEGSKEEAAAAKAEAKAAEQRYKDDAEAVRRVERNERELRRQVKQAEKAQAEDKPILPEADVKRGAVTVYDESGEEIDTIPGDPGAPMTKRAGLDALQHRQDNADAYRRAHHSAEPATPLLPTDPALAQGEPIPWVDASMRRDAPGQGGSDIQSKMQSQLQGMASQPQDAGLLDILRGVHPAPAVATNEDVASQQVVAQPGSVPDGYKADGGQWLPVFGPEEPPPVEPRAPGAPAVGPMQRVSVDPMFVGNPRLEQEQALKQGLPAPYPESGVDKLPFQDLLQPEPGDESMDDLPFQELLEPDLPEVARADPVFSPAMAEVKTVTETRERSALGTEKPIIPDVDIAAKADKLDETLRLEQEARAKAMTEPVQNLQRETLARMKQDPAVAKRVEKLGDLYVMGQIADYERDLSGEKLKRDQANFMAVGQLRAGNRADARYKLDVLRAGLNAEFSAAGLEMQWANLMSADERAKAQLQLSRERARKAGGKAWKRSQSGKDFERSLRKSKSKVDEAMAQVEKTFAEKGLLGVKLSDMFDANGNPTKKFNDVTNDTNRATIQGMKDALGVFLKTPMGKLYHRLSSRGVPDYVAINMYDKFMSMGMSPGQAHNAMLDWANAYKPENDVFVAPGSRAEIATRDVAERQAKAVTAAEGAVKRITDYRAKYANDPQGQAAYNALLKDALRNAGVEGDIRTATPDQVDAVNQYLADKLMMRELLK